MKISTEIFPITDEAYQSIGGLEYIEHPEQENFKQLLFTFKFKYSNRVENVRTEFTHYFKDLLTSKIYWTGSHFYFDDTNRNEYIYQEDIIIYTGDISEEEIVELLSTGTFIVTWIEDGEERRKEFNLGENITF